MKEYNHLFWSVTSGAMEEKKVITGTQAIVIILILIVFHYFYISLLVRSAGPLSPHKLIISLCVCSFYCRNGILENSSC